MCVWVDTQTVSSSEGFLTYTVPESGSATAGEAEQGAMIPEEVEKTLPAISRGLQEMFQKDMQPTIEFTEENEGSREPFELQEEKLIRSVLSLRPRPLKTQGEEEEKEEVPEDASNEEEVNNQANSKQQISPERSLEAIETLRQLGAQWPKGAKQSMLLDMMDMIEQGVKESVKKSEEKHKQTSTPKLVQTVLVLTPTKSED